MRAHPGLAPGVDIFEINLELGRRKLNRVFVGIPEEAKSVSGDLGLVIALNGSNSEGDGAHDLISMPDGYQKNWPLELARRYALPFVAPDDPLFGKYKDKYSDTEMTASSILQDDIEGIVTGIKLLREQLPNAKLCGNALIGGISWGGIRSSMLAAALGSHAHVFLGSTLLEKRHDPRLFFAPREWEKRHSGLEWDYGEMLQNTPVARLHVNYGSTKQGEYLWFRSNRQVVERLSSHFQTRFSWHRSTHLGHVMDIDQMISFGQEYKNATAKGCAVPGSAIVPER